MSLEDRREYMRAYMKLRSSRLKARGICPSCTKREAAPGKTCCVQCLDDKKLTALFHSSVKYRHVIGELLAKQKMQCPICLEPLSRHVIDHCHTSMIIRGLLCQRCNIGLGQFKDNKESLARAIKYLEDSGLSTPT